MDKRLVSVPGTIKIPCNLAVEPFKRLITTSSLPIILDNLPIPLSFLPVCGLKDIKIDQSPVIWDIAPESINQLLDLSFTNIAASASASFSSIAKATDSLLSLLLSRSNS
jgi:hypothetical protein